MLEHEVAVEQDGLNLGQHAVVAVEVRPAGLHHADLGLGKVVDHLHEPVGRGNEVGVEDGDELAFGHLEAGVERSGLEAVAIGAVNVNDGCPERRVAVDDSAGHLLGLVGRVVEHLNFELFARILHGANGLDQPVDDKLLVEDGQLDGDAGQLVEMPRRIGIVVLAVLEVVVAHGVAVNAIERQHDHDREVGQQHRRIEPVPVMRHLGEGVVQHRLQIVAQAVLRSKGQIRGPAPPQPHERDGETMQRDEKRGEQGFSPHGRHTVHSTRRGAAISGKLQPKEAARERDSGIVSNFDRAGILLYSAGQVRLAYRSRSSSTIHPASEMRLRR